MLLVVAVRFLPMSKVNWLNNPIPEACGYTYAVELDFAAVDAHRVAGDAGCCYCAGNWCFVGVPAEALDLNYSIYLHSWFICAVTGSVILLKRIVELLNESSRKRLGCQKYSKHD